MYVGDAVEVLWKAAQAKHLFGKAFFATGDQHMTVFEIAKTITEVLGRGKVTQIEWPEDRKRMEIDNVEFSSNRLQQLIDWKPKSDFLGGLKLTKTILETQKKEKTQA